MGSALKSIHGSNYNYYFVGSADCDLREKSEVMRLFNVVQPKYVIHLASYVPGFYNMDKVASFRDNVRINENVLEASHLNGIEKGIFCSSINMFPENPSKLPLDESMMFEGEPAGVAGYAYSKRMLALQCQQYNEQYNRRYLTIIPCNVYGPNDNLASGRLIPNLILKFSEAISNKTDVVLNGTGKPQRQFIYSLDLAKIMEHLLFNYDSVKPVICCTPAEISIAELAEQIGSLMGFIGKIHFDTSKKDGYLRRTISNAYLQEIMNGVSFTSLETGLKETIGWFLSQQRTGDKQ